MSGIVGVVHVGGAPVDESLLHRLTDALAFRGPEGNNVWVSGQVGFGHTLMRVFDDILVSRVTSRAE